MAAGLVLVSLAATAEAEGGGSSEVPASSRLGQGMGPAARKEIRAKLKAWMITEQVSPLSTLMSLARTRKA